MQIKPIWMASMAALLVSFGISSHAQEVSSPEARAWLQKTFPQQSSEGHYLISSNVLEKSGNWYCGEGNEKFSCRTVTVFPSMSFSVSKKGEFDVSLTPPTSALKDAENINDISLNFSNGDTVYIRHSWDFDREGDDIRSFVHALTSSKNVSLTFNGNMQSWTLSLAGTSHAIDSMAFWAAAHHVSLPAPFYQAETAEVGEDGVVSFHSAPSSSEPSAPLSEVHHEQETSDPAHPIFYDGEGWVCDSDGNTRNPSCRTKSTSPTLAVLIVNKANLFMVGFAKSSSPYSLPEKVSFQNGYSVDMGKQLLLSMDDKQIQELLFAMSTSHYATVTDQNGKDWDVKIDGALQAINAMTRWFKSH